MISAGLLEIANEIPVHPTAPKDKVNSLEEIAGFQRRRQMIIKYLKKYS